MFIVHDWQIFGLPKLYQTLCFIQLDQSAHHGKKTYKVNNLEIAF